MNTGRLWPRRRRPRPPHTAPGRVEAPRQRPTYRHRRPPRTVEEEGSVSWTSVLVILGLISATEYLQRYWFAQTVNKLAAHRSEHGLWNRGSIKRHILRGMGTGALNGWLLVSWAFWTDPFPVQLYLGASAVLIGAGAALILPSPTFMKRGEPQYGGDCTTEPTRERIVEETLAIDAAARDARYWGTMIPASVALGATLTRIELPWWLVGTAAAVAAVAWLVKAANNYAEGALLYPRGLLKRVRDIDHIYDERGDPPTITKQAAPVLWMFDVIRVVLNRAGLGRQRHEGNDDASSTGAGGQGNEPESRKRPDNKSG